jgi:diketogulonate reductase-like aldo/keto reductase
MALTLLKRPIPSSGELLPVVGVGTWQTFDVITEQKKGPLKEVLHTLISNGGKVIDSSPMYGRSEEVVGELSTEAGLNKSLFMATKVWTSGREAGISQMTESLRLLQRKSIELMQIHNLTDWQTHLPTLREWKERGTIKYLGITHYTESAYQQVERIMNQHPIDFVQINYSLGSRSAQERIFPLARDKNIAVLINRPFEEGSLFRKFKGKSLPAWASECDCETWGQLFLKFILAQSAVTCVIPGTSKASHLLDNLKGGSGRLPDNSLQKKMIELMND